MKLILNGNSRDVGDVTNVTSLLTVLGFAQIPVLVEHNGTALFPREYDTAELAEGDTLEIIRVVAGG
ncbi:MAG: sulfur carrier protein ThiS [Verrucomicrobiales bacterium]|nr:sulfur carrier protein ThiS [Verrucomicrobiales bacterium]